MSPRIVLAISAKLSNFPPVLLSELAIESSIFTPRLSKSSSISLVVSNDLAFSSSWVFDRFFEADSPDLAELLVAGDFLNISSRVGFFSSPLTLLLDIESSSSSF